MDRVINFMGARRICFALSAALILLGIGLMAFRGLNLGIDFQGGVHLVVKFSESVSAEAVRSALAEAGFSSAKVVTAPGNEFLIDTTVEEAGTGQRIVQLLGERFPLEDFSITEVGANVGQDLQRRGVIMIVLSLGLLLLYISLRFHWRFAVGAVVALVHDVMITLGLFAAFGLEINLPTLAAFLTVVGYSVNDTIVVFDRIRENQRLLRDMPLVALVNTSITQMLTPDAADLADHALCRADDLGGFRPWGAADVFAGVDFWDHRGDLFFDLHCQSNHDDAAAAGSAVGLTEEALWNGFGVV
ncbi:MAG: hypothetical protein KatS3mg115_1155 [Candidatus Poribacteria bacterium]|nr:MAG: hypothetical protein KatS3mg115_1155 [Candidatus Poribacteria bacterium]